MLTKRHTDKQWWKHYHHQTWQR